MNKEPKTSSLPPEAARFRVCSVHAFSCIAVVALALTALQLRSVATRAGGLSEPVRVYCAARVANTVNRVIEQYNEAYSANVVIVRTGGSGELAGQIKTEFATNFTDGADLYLTADDVLLNKAHEEGMIAERFPLASQRPVIAIRVDSPLQFDSISDLVDDDRVRFGIASQQAAVGKVVRKIALRENVLDRLEFDKTTEAENVLTLAQALTTGSLDAAIIWDTTVNQLNQVEDAPLLKIACFADLTNELNSSIAIGLLNSCDVPDYCAKILSFPERG